LTEYLTTIYILIEIYLSVFFVYCSFNSSLLCYIPVTCDVVQPTDYHRFMRYIEDSLVWYGNCHWDVILHYALGCASLLSKVGGRCNIYTKHVLVTYVS